MGAMFGAQSYSIDLNHFHGSENDWLAFVGGDEEPDPPQEVTPTMLKIQNEGYGYLPLRTSGNPLSPEIGQMPNGEIVTMLDLASPRAAGDVWAKIERSTGQTGWAAFWYPQGGVATRRMLVVNG
jgi:hypothetical protein